MYPKVYIGDIVPNKWMGSYPVVRVNTVEELRNFIVSYLKVDSEFKVGLDVRAINPRRLQPLLKLMEDSKLKLIIRVKEPVLDTILSRAGWIVKKERVEYKNSVGLLIMSQTKIAEKIRNL